jgi:hypothetical protein
MSNTAYNPADKGRAVNKGALSDTEFNEIPEQDRRDAETELEDLIEQTRRELEKN